MRTSFAWSVLCQRIVVLLLSQRSFDLPEHTAPGDRGCHQSCTLSHCFWHPVLRWGGCLGFNFYFFAFAWDPCPSGGTRGYQGVWTWLYFFPLVFGIFELLSPSACRFQLCSAGPVSKLLTRLASHRPPGFLGLHVPVCGAQLKRRLCGRGGAAARPAVAVGCVLLVPALLGASSLSSIAAIGTPAPTAVKVISN